MRTLLTALVLLATAAVAHAGDLIPTDPRFGPLRVASHKVEASIDNQIAIVKVEQVFANDTTAQLEAHYVFPVPKGANLVDFSMTVNGKLMRGELLEKNRAREIYEGIVRKSKDPGLLEHVGSNIFRVRVFPILPGSQQKMELTYLERVNFDAGTCRFVYPLRVPGTPGGTKTDAFDFRLRLASRVPLRDLASSTHRISVARKTEEAAEVTCQGAQVDLTKDLEITYTLERASSGMDLVAHRGKGEDGTFLLLLTPEAHAPRIPKDMTFVFDTSGSMEGPRIRQARAALKFCLSKLTPQDRFNILTFSHQVVTFERTHVSATDEAKEKAVRFVDAIDASGGTNINGALQEALAQKGEDARPHLILFLTDGQPTSGENRPDAIIANVLKARRGNVRVFALGVGNDVNRSFLEDLAESTQAVAEFVAEGEDIEMAVSRLQTKIAAPVISELSIDWGQAAVSAVYPQRLGDLYAGSQLMVVGRYSRAGNVEVKLRGRAGPTPVELKQTLAFPEERAESPGVPYLWGMRKVASLLDEVRRSGENPEILGQIVSLAKTYRLATPYTSFLVLESEAAYDQFGIERRGANANPPAPPANGSGKVFIAPPGWAGPTVPDKTGKSDRLKDDPLGRLPTDEPALFHPEAAGPDHNESDDGEDFHQMKGESGSFRGRQVGKAPGTYDTMGLGVGGGGGGRFGGRLGGREALVTRGGGTASTESAVSASLKWLASNQNPDGSWSAGDKAYDAGATALSLLAFLGAGYSHLSRDEYIEPLTQRKISFGQAVKRGVQWLLAQQDPEGCVGGRGLKYMYVHAISSLALSEAYGMTASAPLKEPAQKAIDFLIASQNPGKGWRYSAKAGESDTSVTVWAVLALKSAELSDLAFPKSAYEGALAWLDSVTDPAKGYAVRYGAKEGGTPSAPGTSEGFESHPTMSAMGVLARILIQKKRDEPALSAVNLLLGDLPEAKARKTDPYYWYFASLAVFQFDGPNGSQWRRWNEAIKTALVSTELKDGSWSEKEVPWGSEAGKVTVTALNTLTLQTYYRYPSVFGGKR